MNSTSTIGFKAFWLWLALGLASCTGGSSQPPDAGEEQDATIGEDEALGEDEAIREDKSIGEDGDPGGDRAPGDFWSWCPNASSYQGGNWNWILKVTDGALYCETFDESRTLDQELALKAMLRVIPGEYALPSESGEYPFRLPICLRFGEADAQPLLAGVGRIVAGFNVFDGQLNYDFSIKQALRTAAGQDWDLTIRLSGIMPAGQNTVTLDGAHHSCRDFVFLNLAICPGNCEFYPENSRFYDSCGFDGVPEGRQTVIFTGGQIELFLRMGCSMASTEPALFTRAKGTLDGTAFEQTDYWKLIYSPEHHHFVRDFAILFEAPIGQACGVKVERQEMWPQPPFGRLTTLRCDLSEIEERAIQQESWDPGR